LYQVSHGELEEAHGEIFIRGNAEHQHFLIDLLRQFTDPWDDTSGNVSWETFPKWNPVGVGNIHFPAVS